MKEIAVYKRKVGYVLRVPVSETPPPTRIRLICGKDVIEARLMTVTSKHAYYRVYSRYTGRLLKHAEGGECVLEYAP